MNRREVMTLVVGGLAAVGSLVAAGCRSQVQLGSEPGDESAVTEQDASNVVKNDASSTNGGHPGSDGSDDAFASFEAPDAGLYLVVNGSSGSSPLAGSYACGVSSFCVNDPYVAFACPCGFGSVTLQVDGVSLGPGGPADSAASPHVHVTFDLGTIDDGMYPVGQQGSCTATYVGTGGLALYEFSCTGLVGIGSGATFAASGIVQC